MSVPSIFSSRPDYPPFHAPSMHKWLSQASPAEMDAVDFGIIEVDDDGVVLFYNAFESEFSGMAKDEVMGRSFFTDIAPCSNNPLFFGRFREGLTEETHEASLRYTLTYRIRPTLVNVRILRHEGRNWVLITPHTRTDSLGSRLAFSRQLNSRAARRASG